MLVQHVRGRGAQSSPGCGHRLAIRCTRSRRSVSVRNDWPDDDGRLRFVTCVGMYIYRCPCVQNRSAVAHDLYDGPSVFTSIFPRSTNGRKTILAVCPINNFYAKTTATYMGYAISAAQL
jgi:hypothetical protein